MLVFANGSTICIGVTMKSYFFSGTDHAYCTKVLKIPKQVLKQRFWEILNSSKRARSIESCHSLH